MRVMHTVEDCYGCPLEDADGEICMHPSVPQSYAKGVHTTRGEPPPDECPLRKGELLITLRAK